MILPFILGVCLSVCLLFWGSLGFCFIIFLLPFLQCCLVCRVLLLWPGLGPEPLRWESQVQDTGPPEDSQPHGILISESSPRGLHLNTNTQLHPTASKLQCWTPQAKQLARQEHNPPISRQAA